MVQAVERVRQRLLRAAAALEAAQIPYAVVGGNAVAAWVATVDPSAVRNTQDVDILLRRADLEAAKVAMQAAGFIHRHVAAMDIFLDGPNARARDAVHVVLAGEKVRTEYAAAAPDVTDAEKPDQFRVLTLESLVKMKLTSFRRKAQVHLQDMLEVGLIDQSWVSRFPRELGSRLQQLIDTPEG
ncbi:MAG: nucleotidyltransferase family protein [Anaerolineae bacterium]|nr:nucleotidyltransferase family protein [Phycisphaerae bacterium]